MQDKTFAIWGGRFRDTATAWTLGAGPADVLDMFQLGGPFTRAEADQACLEGIRRNIDICAHRMLVVEIGAQRYESWASATTQQHQAAVDSPPVASNAA